MQIYDSSGEEGKCCGTDCEPSSKVNAGTPKSEIVAVQEIDHGSVRRRTYETAGSNAMKCIL
jgi:hypothetical protein